MQETRIIVRSITRVSFENVQGLGFARGALPPPQIGRESDPS